MRIIDSLKHISTIIFGKDEPQKHGPIAGNARIPYNTLIAMMGDIVPLNTTIPTLSNSRQTSASELWEYMRDVFDGTHCADKDFQKKSSISAYIALVRHSINASVDAETITIPAYHIRALMAKKDDMYLVARFAEQNGSTAPMPALPAKVNNPTLRYIFDSRNADRERVSGRWNAQIIRQFAANIDMLEPYVSAHPAVAAKIEPPAVQGVGPWARSGRRPF